MNKQEALEFSRNYEYSTATKGVVEISEDQLAELLLAFRDHKKDPKTKTDIRQTISELSTEISRLERKWRVIDLKERKPKKR